jgi:hypothetical protein
LNHLVGQNQIRVVIASDRLDQSSTDVSPGYVNSGIRLNLHCWHTNDRFSKFAFKMGHYNQSELVKYRNDTTAQAYVRRDAIFSSRPSARFCLGDANGSGIEILHPRTARRSRSTEYDENLKDRFLPICCVRMNINVSSQIDDELTIFS